MPAQPMKVLFVSSEVAPFAKTGGLGDVVGALPKALRRRGVDARVVMPLYAGMRWHELEPLDGALRVPMWWGTATAGVRLGRLPGSDVPVYFLEYNRYFDRPYLYGPPEGGYGDNLERFAFLSRGALEVAKALRFFPDVLHAHDWQAALAPIYANTVEWMQPLHAAASVYTIHNLAYQGVTSGDSLFVTGLGREHYNSGELEHYSALNLTKGVLRHATMLSTVSPTYAREIQMPEHGCGLDGVLRGRAADLVGILNGVDLADWNPATDPHIAARYTATRMEGKDACKASLQLEAGFRPEPGVPLFAAVGRLTHQKGFDVLARALERVLDWDVQVVLLGAGDRDAERYFRALSARRPDRFRAWIGFDDGLAHRMTAGSDFLVMPSRFEPCGLSQMYAMLYGSLPIVRSTGGLVDTVQGYDEAAGAGTGFRFEDLTPDALANVMGWAVSTWHDRRHHVLGMRERAMAQDFSWDRSAAAYEALYREAYRRRRGHTFPG